MNKITYASFYTLDTPYEEIIQKYFVSSYHNIFKNSDYIITALKNYESWYTNVAYKPKIILDLLNTIKKDLCLVFLDADAEILKYPKLFEEIPQEYDIAYHYLDWNIWYGYQTNPSVKELLTGTMFFRNNDKVKTLCERWYNEAVRTKEWEQKVLERVIKHYPIKVFQLPLEYCMMSSRPGNKPPLMDISNAVILHHQVSRELKKRLK